MADWTGADVRNTSARAAFGIDANRAVADKPGSCTWRGCRQERFDDLPVCIAHGLVIAGRIREAFPTADIEPPPPSQPYVYYLMLGPATVKIGTTRGLRARLVALRTEPQYVVAIERGGMDIERQRHKQFAAERLSRREDFRLSDRLKRHIEALQTHRDALIDVAMNPQLHALS